MSAVAEWAIVAGVGRDVLEARLRALVAAVEALEQRLEGRAANANRSANLHPDGATRDTALARRQAYLCALEDMYSALSALE